MAEEYNSILEYADDLADAEAPASLAAGQYPATISAAANGKSATSGKKRVQVDWIISPEDFPADFEDAEEFPDGKTVSTYQGSEANKPARYRMRKFIESIGGTLGSKIDINDWVGKKAILTIEPEEFEGVYRERVKKVEAL